MATALITGGTAGLGRGFAEALAAEGHDLVLVARNEDRLRETADQLFRQYGVHVEVLPADLTDGQQLAAVEQRLADPDRPVDILVNNAGIGLKQQFVGGDLGEEQAMLDLLVTAPMRLSHAAVGGMVARGQGSIINISSMAGFISAGSYSAAKAYLTVFTEALAGELHGTGVTATVVCPGFVHTEFHERAGISKGGIPSFLWLNVPQVVRDGLKDAKRGRVVSVPGRQYQVLSTLAQYGPRPVVRKVSELRKR
jgi:short-subunit dehydrogenase